MALVLFLLVCVCVWVLILAEVQWRTGDFLNTFIVPGKVVARVLRPRRRAQHPYSYRDLSTRTVVPYRQEPVMPRQPHEKPDPSSMARQIALAEAAIGIDLPLDPNQPCPVCGHARLVGARYCSDCRYDWEPEPPIPHALLCTVCDKRIPDDSKVCPYCGLTISEAQRLWNADRVTLPTPVGEGAWRCVLCGMVFTWHNAPQPQERPRTCVTCGARFDWLYPPNPYRGDPKLREPSVRADGELEVYDTTGDDLVFTVGKPDKPKRPRKATKGRPPTAASPAARTGSPFVLDPDLIGTVYRGWSVGQWQGGYQPHQGLTLAQATAMSTQMHGLLRSVVVPPPGGNTVWDLRYQGGTLVTEGKCPHCNQRVTPDENRALCPACKGALSWPG